MFKNQLLKEGSKKMKKITDFLKNYRPPRHICFLYFFLSFMMLSRVSLDSNTDIWYILKYGEHILHQGFPVVDFLSMHKTFPIIMQQWLSAVIFYICYFSFIIVLFVSFMYDIK